MADPSSPTSPPPPSGNLPADQDVDSYEQYAGYMNALKDEQSQFPLIAPLLPLDIGLGELFQGDTELSRKMTSLSTEKGYTAIRCIRRDGSCFIRSVAFRLLELLLEKKRTTGQSVAILQLSEMLNKTIVPNLIKIFGEYVEDFVAPIQEILVQIAEGSIRSSDELCAAVSEPGRSEYIVCFFRYCISYWMRTHAEEFLPFLIDFPSIEQYCSNEVECVGKECDHLHIQSFAEMFSVRIEVEYTDGHEGTVATTHEFGPPATDGGAIHLLYRPGHYDLLYK
jgi:ubiquitin thioesterase protein OTUB1